MILIGKSIGTLTLAALLQAGEAQGALVIWLTPLLHQPIVVNAALAAQTPSLFIVGNADHTYDASAMERIRQATGAEVVLIEGGDHRLEVEGDIYRSLRAMEEILHGIEKFVARYSVVGS